MKFLIYSSLFLFVGCASFVEQPKVDASVLESSKKYKYNSVIFKTQLKSGCNIKECNDLFVSDSRNLSQEGLDYLNNIKIVLNKKAPNERVLTVYTDVTIEGKAVNPIWQFLTGLTYLLIPMRANTIYTVDAVVMDKNKILKQYSYQANQTTWVQLFLIVAIPFQWNQSNRIVRNLYNKTLESMIKDGII